jgi:hypothetical protein
VRALLAAFALSCTAACSGHCCSDGECWGNDVCSELCAPGGSAQGTCLVRCQVDADCNGQVCDEFHGSCACDAPVDGGVGGSCPQGTNPNGA